MRPLLHELLQSIRWTFDEKVAPHVGDALAQSYARTLSALLDHAERRARHEAVLLAEESTDLRNLLAYLRPQAPPDIAAAISVATCVAAATPDTVLPQAQAADVETLRKLLITVIRDAPECDQGMIDAYLARQLDRDAKLNPTRTSPAM